MEGYPPLSWLNNIPLCICSTSFLFIHSLMGTWVVFISWLLGTMQPSPWECIYSAEILFSFLGYIRRSGISRLYNTSIFNFLRKFRTVYYSGCTSLHSHQWYMKIPFSWHPSQHLLFFAFDDSHYGQAFGDISLWLSLPFLWSVMSIFSRVCWPFWCTLCLLFFGLFFNWTFCVCVMKVTKFFIHFEC